MSSWRARRGLSLDALAARLDWSASGLEDLEAGRDWVDRRGRLAALADALRLDPTDLTGQPYAPVGLEHGTVRAVAVQMRHILGESATTLDEAENSAGETLESQVAEALDAQLEGDEGRLALILPTLIRTADRAVVANTGTSLERSAELRMQSHVLAAGLLRRLGYRDLAWVLLHRARPGLDEPRAVLLEEARLLLDLGMPHYALARTARARASADDIEVSVLEACAAAVAGQDAEARRILQNAGRAVGDGEQAAALASAGVIIAVEGGRAQWAAERIGDIDQDRLRPAARAGLLLAGAAATARIGDGNASVRLLLRAEADAPMRVRLDPAARDLLAVLPSHAADSRVAAQARELAERVGVL